jgi:glycerophosphoryl diester phosphodiesterase
MNKNNIFHDLSYHLTRKLDKFVAHNRIKIYSVVCIIIFLRLYEYYIPGKHKKVEIQGHRGARGVLPENTLAAFKYAIENNIYVLELDLQITKDNQIIIYHDKSINTDICVGVSKSIKTLSLKEIKEYDCGSKKNIKFPNQQTVSGEKIPTLIELINLIQTEYKNKNIKMNIEIKTTKSLDTDHEVYNFSNTLIDILHKYNIANDIIIQSFDTRALKYVKEIDTSIKTSYLIEDKIQNIDSLINTSKQLGVKIISPEYNLLDKQIVKKLQENGFEVLPWTINDVNTFQKNIDYNVDGVITDYPKQMNDYLNDYLKK